MSVEFNCTGCGQRLRLADEHAGKKARCPQCQAIVDVPQISTPVDQPAAPEPAAGAEREEYRGDPEGFETPPPQQPQSGVNPYASPGARDPMTGAENVRPHRGGTVLTFGILGWACCFVFGIAAWVMGRSDLSEMRQGRMDRSGEGITMAGMILGIVQCALCVLILLFYGFFIAVAVIAEGF